MDATFSLKKRRQTSFHFKVGEPGGSYCKWNKLHKMANTALSQLYLESNKVELLKAE